MEHEYLQQNLLIKLSSEEQKSLEENITIGIYKQLHSEKLLTDSQLDKLIRIQVMQRR